MEIPVKEIEYLASFVEADTENDLYEISEAAMAQVNIVREWLKAVEQSRALDGAYCSCKNPDIYINRVCQLCGKPHAPRQ